MQVDEDAGGARCRPHGRRRVGPCRQVLRGRVVEFRAKHLLAAVAPAVVRRLAGPADDAASRRPDQDQHAAGPAAAAGVRPGPADGLRRHDAPRAGVLGSRGRLRHSPRAGTLPPVLPSEVYCHSLTDPIDPERPAGRDAHPVRPARVRRPVPGGSGGRQDGGGGGGARRAADAPRRAAAWTAWPATERPALPRHRLPGRPAGRARHAGRATSSTTTCRGRGWRTTRTPTLRPGAYGVEIDGSDRILLAGAGSRRGGGVSGLGGAAAVDALLEMTVRTPAAAR